MNNNDILTGRIWPTFLRYSLPWTLSMLTSGSAAIIDGIFIGQYAGAIALASVNIVAPVWGFMGGVGIMLASGGSAISGNYIGKGDVQSASAMLIKTLLAILGWSLAFFIVFFLFQEPALYWMGGRGELLPDSQAYLRILLYFSPIFPLCFALSYFVRLDGRPVLASMGFIICAGANVVLDWFFINYKGMGVVGAGIATGIAYCVPCVIYATHFVSRKCSFILPKKLGKWDEVLKAAWNGSSEFVNETSAGIVILLFNIILVSSMGPMGVAAFTVIGYITMMGGLLCFGIADTLTPLISVNNGAKKFARVKKFLGCALIMVTAVDLLLLLYLSCWPRIIVDLFLMDAHQATEIALEFIAAARWEFLFLGLNIAFTSYFTGRLWAPASFITAFGRGLLFPCLLLSLLPMCFGPEGIFFVPAISEAMTFGLAIAIYCHMLKRNSKNSGQTL